MYTLSKLLTVLGFTDGSAEMVGYAMIARRKKRKFMRCDC